MTKQLKYKVIVSGKEQLFSTRKEVCDFLEIKESTLYTIMTGSTKLKASKLQKLMGIQVEKLDVYYHSKPSIEMIEKEALKNRKYQEAIVNKMNNVGL